VTWSLGRSCCSSVRPIETPALPAGLARAPGRVELDRRARQIRDAADALERERAEREPEILIVAIRLDLIGPDDFLRPPSRTAV